MVTRSERASRICFTQPLPVMTRRVAPGIAGSALILVPVSPGAAAAQPAVLPDGSARPLLAVGTLDGTLRVDGVLDEAAW